MAETQENTRWAEPDLKYATRAVLESFRSAPLLDAFETAVRAYRRHNPNIPTALARRAVAKIICGG